MLKVSVYILTFLIFISCSENNKDISLKQSTNTLTLIDDKKSMFSDLVLNDNDIKIIFSKIEPKKIDEQIIEKTKDDLVYRIRKISTEHYLSNNGVSKSELEKNLKDLEGEQIFYFEYEDTHKENLFKKYFDEDETPIKYLSFKIMNDFMLITEKGDTLKALYSQYENSSHISPTERVLLSFPKINKEERFKLIFKDNLFKKEIVNFSYPSEIELINNYNTAL